MRKTLLMMSLSTTLLCAGCGGGDGAKGIAAASDGSREAAIAALKNSDANAVASQVAATLQACSYDGKPVQFGMGGEAPGNCRDMIAQVMNFTGLPQNFDVTEADVPNAAAAILLDQQRLPHRVIAFNPDFIDLVKQATGGNVWAAVSVMAHEAGHHLAGHTIQPGGSQPPIELEADKFSGFVLYKMGASRDDALKAIKTLVPAEVPAGASHPARDARVAAITEGWDQACRQTGRGDCGNGAPGSTPPAGIVNTVAQTPVAPRQDETTLPPSPVRATPPPASAPATAPVATVPTVVVMPTPDPKALPTKGTQFVYDETGLLDKATVAAMEQKFYEHARDKGVEIVSIFAKDLHGTTPEQYAWAMMRQLRVGKLDVGNGVVIVWDTAGGRGGVAMGPGVRKEMEFHIDSFPTSAKRMLDSAWSYCVQKNGCGLHTENFFLFADNIRRDTAHWEWTVRFQSMRGLFDLAKKEFDARRDSDERFDPKQSGTWRKLVRLSGTVVQLDPPAGGKKPTVSDLMYERGQRVAYVRTDDGLDVLLSFHPQTEALMPAGALRKGQHYSFIGREDGLSWNEKDDQKLELYSYDLLQ